MEEYAKNDIRCVLCGYEFNLQSIIATQKTKGCPNCGVHETALKIKDDQNIRMNWQEVRVLAIYAQRWASTFDISNPGNKTAVGILNRIVSDLERYRPLGLDGLDPSIKAPEIAEEIEVRKIKGIPSPFFKKQKL